MPKHALVWMRRDLRFHDHPAISYALKSFEKVTLVFIFDEAILSPLRCEVFFPEIKRPSDRRVTFLIDTLLDLKKRLPQEARAFSDLLVFHGQSVELIPKLCRDLSIDCVITHRDYEPKARLRDESVGRKLEEDGKKIVFLKDHALLNPEDILTKDKTPYKVFTPYKRAWLSEMEKDPTKVFGDFSTPAIKRERSNSMTGTYPVWVKENPFQQQLSNHSRDLWHRELDFTPVAEDLWPVGREKVQKTLTDFALNRASNYNTARDIPATSGTSKLSPYLRFGLVSPREVARMVGGDQFGHFQQLGAGTYLSELIWRDFYFMILFFFPHVADSAFRPEYDAITWTKGDEAKERLQRWCQGKTGIPLVDAGMRELNTTGWMHNRLRMITANYFCKILLLDWRQGEAYFARELMDFDLSANNGGWQWSSSSGCDAQPYFRIFSPIAQAERFDPDATYIKRWVPEIAHAPTRALCDPESIPPLLWTQTFGPDYQKPLVSYKTQREACLALYAKFVKKEKGA